MKTKFYENFGKRLIDIILSVLALIVLSPVLLGSAICIKMEDGGRIFFIQKRIGRDFKPFHLIKFRTMNENNDTTRLITQKNDSRITKAGRFLRKFKIDEIPQLFNILSGQMSLVGPRPEVEKYVNLFKDDYKIILQKYPGLSDYASIKYRNEDEILGQYDDLEKAYLEIILPDKIEINKKYVKNVKISDDFKIIWQTIGRLFNAG